MCSETRGRASISRGVGIRGKTNRENHVLKKMILNARLMNYKKKVTSNKTRVEELWRTGNQL